MTRFVVLDVGNSAIHAALATPGNTNPIDPQSTPTTLGEDNLSGASSMVLDELVSQSNERIAESLVWWTVSVNRARLDRFRDWLRNHRPQDQIRQLRFDDAPLPLQVESPDKLGMDRVAAAVAADSLRTRDSAAIIVDSGTAITVDVVDAAGSFLGGAILPGVGMAAVALDERTDGLPRIIPLDQPPRSIGANTESAIRSGLFWGTYGGVKELIDRHARTLETPYEVFLTGGAAVWANLFTQAKLVPNLTLLGVAQMAGHAQRKQA